MAQVSPDKDESMSDNESMSGSVELNENWEDAWLRETDPCDTADAQTFHVEGGIRLIEDKDLPIDDDLDLKNPVMTIVEKTNEKHAEFLMRLYFMENGREKLLDLFDLKEETDYDVFKMVYQYLVRSKASNYELPVAYYRAKTTPKSGRLYARVGRGVGYGGHQRIPREIRIFLQTGIYYDYDMIAASNTSNYAKP